MIAYTVNHRVSPQKKQNDNLSISYPAVVLMELHIEFATVGGVVAFFSSNVSDYVESLFGQTIQFDEDVCNWIGEPRGRLNLILDRIILHLSTLNSKKKNKGSRI